MDSDKTEAQAQSCFMCQQAGQGGCLECRTHRLIADIKTSLYERLGAEQNQSEWEERALAAEQALQAEREKGADIQKLVDAARSELGRAPFDPAQHIYTINKAKAIFDAVKALAAQEVEKP